MILDLSINSKFSPIIYDRLKKIAFSKKDYFNNMIGIVSESLTNNVDWLLTRSASRNTHQSQLYYRFCCMILIEELILEGEKIDKIFDHAWYKCYIFIRPEGMRAEWTRDRIIEEINSRGVPCYHGSCSEVYLERAFDGTGFRPKERLPVAKELGETSLMFLVHPTLTREEIELACSVIEEVAKLASR